MIKIKIKNNNMKEGLKGPDDDLISNIIRTYVRYNEQTDPESLKNLKSDLESLGIKWYQAIDYLTKDIMASESLVKAIETHNNMVRLFKQGKERDIGAFGRYPSNMDDNSRVKAANYSVSRQDQEDTRKGPHNIDKKNLKQGISENIDSPEQFISSVLRFSVNNDKQFNMDMEGYLQRGGDISGLLGALENISLSNKQEIKDNVLKFADERDRKFREEDPPDPTEFYPDDNFYQATTGKPDLHIVKERIINFGLGPALRRK